MNTRKIAIAGWGTLETAPETTSWTESWPERWPRWLRPWRLGLVGLGRLLAGAIEVAVEAVLVLLPRT